GSRVRRHGLLVGILDLPLWRRREAVHRRCVLRRRHDVRRSRLSIPSAVLERRRLRRGSHVRAHPRRGGGVLRCSRGTRVLKRRTAAFAGRAFSGRRRPFVPPRAAARSACSPRSISGKAYEPMFRVSLVLTVGSALLLGACKKDGASTETPGAGAIPPTVVPAVAYAPDAGAGKVEEE